MTELGERLSLWTMAPFALILGAIAVLPLVAGDWFHHNRNKGIVAAVLGLPTVVYLVAAFGSAGLDAIGVRAEEYVSFIALLAALYIISGGVYLTGNLVPTPLINLGFLAGGAVLANIIGTMGASMLLVRPLLRANSERVHQRHTVVFFVFAVSNIGGMLTPLGDPPLLLGFLGGVPFGWTLRLWPQWLLSLGLLLAVYLLVETRFYREEPAEARRRDRMDYVPMRLKGKSNLLLLALVVAAVALTGPIGRVGEHIHVPVLPAIVVAIPAVASLLFTSQAPRRANSFSWAPIVEVAVIFAGIFATMIPALALLEAHGAGIGVSRPWQYLWSTGWLSAFLDNAPTYLAFASIAEGQAGVATIGELASGVSIAGHAFTSIDLLAAISTGAVVMGALTYIGNAPNFAVRAIAESSGVEMPTFLGFMKYSLAVVVPIMLVVTAVLFI